MSSSSDSKGKVSVVAAPLEKTEFVSWRGLEDYLRAYERSAYQINACGQVVDGREPTFTLRKTSSRLEHNHPLNKRSFNQYPHNRTALEPEVVTTVNALRKAGAKEENILVYIHDNSTCNPTLQDVHNLVGKLKKQEHTANTSAKRLKQWMVEFSEQTDATHGTNLSKYKVFSIMTHDAFDNEQFVQHVITRNERTSTLFTALEEFERDNRVKRILINKGIMELGVLKTAFPATRSALPVSCD
ncbi:hypothetical protein F444_18258 [Phytophthora nicotianae P1976]|uniref:ZSWIM1/3 RNaseH-like domain-containing protein n=1 Tax=Phytophthora nicotianae P1976 TaxID=1317066 RepID=A0A080ZC03_PHYNI|nr:hypothetical protein F444_18258 [Phytophthora nicotianae P1976]